MDSWTDREQSKLDICFQWKSAYNYWDSKLVIYVRLNVKVREWNLIRVLTVDRSSEALQPWCEDRRIPLCGGGGGCCCCWWWWWCEWWWCEPGWGAGMSSTAGTYVVPGRHFEHCLFSAGRCREPRHRSAKHSSPPISAHRDCCGPPEHRWGTHEII